MLYILDTDHVSLLQRQHPSVLAKLARIPVDNRAITSITAYEQMRGRMAVISRAKSEEFVGRGLVRLQEAIAFLADVQIIPYDQESQLQYEKLRQLKLRIGTQDLRIAAIVLRHNAILVTRNLRHFEHVPKLQVEDWTIG